MISRRKVLFGAAGLGAAAMLSHAERLLAAASQPSTPVNFSVPAGACDCHTHIFGDMQRFPMWSGRTYTPEPASIEEMRKLHRALRTTRVVIVNPSIYGTTNDCTIDAVRRQSPNARGIAVIDAKTPEAQLDEMHRAGIRGIRLNFETFGQADPAAARRQLQAAVQRIAKRGWHVQIYTRLAVIEGIGPEVMKSEVPVVFDHFGGAQASAGTGQAGFGTLLNLVRSGHAYVKISAPYRISTQKPDYPDVAPMAKALIAANPQRIVWGTDWPHPMGVAEPGHSAADVEPLLQVDDGRILNLLPAWAPDAATRKTILVENPARLYGF